MVRLTTRETKLSSLSCSRAKVVVVVVVVLMTNLMLLQTTEAFAAANSVARRNKCSQERQIEMDICASKIGFLGDHSFRVPKNLTQATGSCNQIKESITCIQAYARDCLQGFTRQLLMSLLKRGKQQYSSVCADNKAKQYLMDKMACLSDDKIEPLHSCMDASVARFEFIASKAVKPDNRLPGICCSYQLFNREIDTTLERVCGKTGPGKAGSTNEFIHKIVGGTAGEFFQLICDGHRSMEECRSSRKTGEYMRNLEEITELAESGKLKTKNKSLVPVLLEILDSSTPQ